MPLELHKWLATTTYIIGMALTALNVFPVNLWFQTGGAALWAMAAVRMRDGPILANEGVAFLIYGGGIALSIFITYPTKGCS